MERCRPRPNNGWLSLLIQKIKKTEMHPYSVWQIYKTRHSSVVWISIIYIYFNDLKCLYIGPHLQQNTLIGMQEFAGVYGKIKVLKKLEPCWFRSKKLLENIKNIKIQALIKDRAEEEMIEMMILPYCVNVLHSSSFLSKWMNYICY